MATPLEAIKDRLMISSDAFEVGDVVDIRYDPFVWDVVGLRVRTKRSSNKLYAGHGKSSVLILPEKFILNDVVLLAQPIEIVKDAIIPDSDNIASLSSLISSKVVTRDNALVGTITTVMIDTEHWKVLSIIVRLDKSAVEAMGMKKGLFSKISAEIGTDLILSSAEMVHLNEHMDGVRNNMTIVE
ncbi:MAG: PRC-barrel domain-containing protein [Methanomassiliicoccaceae archaeon]|nr:PRC-barrel domain-containing protein [Methanomassiliicoccaceae archaeon]